MYVYIYIHVHIYIFIYLFIYICVYIYSMFPTGQATSDVGVHMPLCPKPKTHLRNASPPSALVDKPPNPRLPHKSQVLESQGLGLLGFRM